MIPDGKQYYEGFFHERVYYNSQLLLGYFSEEVILYTEGIVNKQNFTVFPHFIQCINKLYAKQKKKTCLRVPFREIQINFTLIQNANLPILCFLNMERGSSVAWRAVKN